MRSLDAETLNFYAAEAETYALQAREAKSKRLDPFLAALPAGATILELGCGGGQDSLVMLTRGFDVTSTDGSPEMAKQAEQLLGRPVAVLPFDQLEERDIYDGVWANACLLHVPRPELAAVLFRIHRALKPDGIFYASYKAGDGGRPRPVSPLLQLSVSGLANLAICTARLELRNRREYRRRLRRRKNGMAARDRNPLGMTRPCRYFHPPFAFLARPPHIPAC